MRVTAIRNIGSCPKEGWSWQGVQGVIFLRGSAGVGFAGVQFLIEKQITPHVQLDEGWNVSGGFAGNVFGATIEFGGGGSGTWTYGPL
jgi:hypothetical protein